MYAYQVRAQIQSGLERMEPIDDARAIATVLHTVMCEAIAELSRHDEQRAIELMAWTVRLLTTPKEDDE